MTTVAGVFQSHDAVQRALTELMQHYTTSQVRIMASQGPLRRDVVVRHTDGLASGAGLGAVAGAVLGVMLVSTGVVTGPVALVGVGPALQLLGGAAAGAAGGTAYGAFMGLGYWGEVAVLHDSEVGRGAVWIGIDAGGREGESEEVLRRHGALHVVQVKS